MITLYYILVLSVFDFSTVLRILIHFCFFHQSLWHFKFKIKKICCLFDKNKDDKIYILNYSIFFFFDSTFVCTVFLFLGCGCGTVKPGLAGCLKGWF